jgi:hypothetical protein
VGQWLMALSDGGKMGHGFTRMNTDFSDFIRFESLICVDLCLSVS